MIQERDDIVALDSAIIQHPRTWEASGHLAGFSDPLVQCLGKCKRRFRLDTLQEEAEARGEDPETVKCPVCGGDLTEPRAFNLMFQTTIGPGAGGGLDRLPAPRDRAGHLPRLQDDAAASRARSRRSASRRSASRSATRSRPANFIFRTLEFEQMEMEFFVPPDEAQQWYEYWCQERLDWYTRLGIRREHLRLRPHTEEELSHYSSGDQRRRVPVRGHAGASSRASPTAATSTSRSTPSSRGEKLE